MLIFILSIFSVSALSISPDSLILDQDLNTLEYHNVTLLNDAGYDVSVNLSFYNYFNNDSTDYFCGFLIVNESNIFDSGKFLINHNSSDFLSNFLSFQVPSMSRVNATFISYISPDAMTGSFDCSVKMSYNIEESPEVVQQGRRGGGGGGRNVWRPNIEPIKDYTITCVPEYNICTEWNSCDNGQQNRRCNDSNVCTRISKVEKRNCEESEIDSSIVNDMVNYCINNPDSEVCNHKITNNNYTMDYKEKSFVEKHYKGLIITIVCLLLGLVLFFNWTKWFGNDIIGGKK